MLALEVALLSDRGGRRHNEDACGHWHDERHLCCVVADGAGGHGGGDIASRLAVQDLIQRFARQPALDGAALEGLLRLTNHALIEQRVPGTPRADMHSTVVCLVIDFVGHRAHWAHAGDSRMYWFRHSRVQQRTRDHSVVQAMIDHGMLKEGDVRKHPRRSELRSALGMAGDDLEVSSGEGAGPVQAGDAFLLCTDGLWEFVDDRALEAALAAAATPRAWLEAIEAEVRRAASQKAGHDNFSALAVWSRAADA